MTPQEANSIYGATHYQTMKDKVTPQMYYKFDWFCPIQKEFKIWYYLSFANLWMGSGYSRETNIPNMEEIHV